MIMRQVVFGRHPVIQYRIGCYMLFQMCLERLIFISSRFVMLLKGRFIQFLSVMPMGRYRLRPLSVRMLVLK